MEVLFTLEKKVKSLVVCIKDLKEQLCALQTESSTLKDTIETLKAENTQLITLNAQLSEQLSSLQDSILLEADSVKELKEERSITRSALDDLIKSIDSIVENEN